MPNRATDKRSNKIKSVFTWSFILSPGKGQRANRRLIRFLSEIFFYGELMSTDGFQGEPDWACGPPIKKK